MRRGALVFSERQPIVGSSHAIVAVISYWLSRHFRWRIRAKSNGLKFRH